jgi:hypothetical protein
MKKPTSYQAVTFSVFLAIQWSLPAGSFLLTNQKHFVIFNVKNEPLSKASKPKYYFYPTITSSRSFLTVSTADAEEAQHRLNESGERSYKQGDDGIWHLSSKEEHT